MAVKAPRFAELLKNVSSRPTPQLAEQLRALLAAGTEPESSLQEAAYMLGRILQRSSNSEDQTEALRLFSEASKLEPLWERCQWHISECAAALGEEKTVRRALEAIRERSPDEISRAGAEYGLAQSYLRANETQPAQEAFTLVRQKYAHSQYALGAAYYLGEALLDSTRGRSEALSLFRAYLRESPDGHFARNIVSRLTQLSDFQPTEADHDLFGQVHYVHGEWEPALSEWSKTKPDRRWYERATCLLRLGRANEAKTAYQSGIKSHPNDPSVPEAARTLCTLLSKDQAASVWQTVLASSPRFADIALWNLALRSSPSQAQSYYNRIVYAYPNSDYAPESTWCLIWNQSQNGRPAQAIARAEAALKRYPSSRAAPRFAFWAGKLRERLKQTEAARTAYKRAAQEFPSHYYGHRARARLDALSKGRDPGWAVRSERRYPDPGWSWPDPPYLVSWEEIAARSGSTQAVLARLGQWEECLQLLPANAYPVLRAWLLAKLDLSLDAINVMSNGLKGGPERQGCWELSYPLLYSQEIARQSRIRKIDPLLVHALVREESRYNPLAVSSSKALGLMQLLPGTANGVAKRIGLSLSSADQIYEPANNIALGTAYLASTLQRANGNAILAIAGYNGGPNAVRTWHSRFRQRGLADYDIFVEAIPYAETRDYVRKVFASFWNYEAIYAAKRS